MATQLWQARFHLLLLLEPCSCALQMLAAEASSTEACMRLIELKADASLLNSSRNSAMTLALRARQYHVAQVIVPRSRAG